MVREGDTFLDSGEPAQHPGLHQPPGVPSPVFPRAPHPALNRMHQPPCRLFPHSVIQLMDALLPFLPQAQSAPYMPSVLQGAGR